MTPRHSEQDVADRFEELDDSESIEASETSETRWLGVVGAGSLAAILATIFLVVHTPTQSVLAMVLGGAGAAGVAIVGVCRWMTWRPRKVAPIPRRALVLGDRLLHFEDAANVLRTLVVRLDGPFGVTLLANRARSRAAMVITTPDAAFYVGAILTERDHDLRHRVLAHASLVASEESALEPAAPDGLPFIVSGSTLSRLHQRLVDIEPLACERVFTSDARGNAIVVDGRVLSVGKQVFDLGSPLEWRSLLFREMFLGALGVFQGTHIRQGDGEVVFVSMLPALSVPSTLGDSPADPDFERAVARDVRLLSAVLEEPPLAPLRVAVDRVLMLPLRASLDRAPLRMSTLPPGELAGAAQSSRHGVVPRSSAS